MRIPIGRVSFLVLLAAVGVACEDPPLPPPALPVEASFSENGPILVVGDTQRTFWLERLIGREQNEAARRALVARMAEEEQPCMLVHLGDLVVYGASDAEWHYFDRLLSPLRERGIPILPVLGNHDYWGSDAAALEHARARFAVLVPHTYYTRRQQGLGLVWLDSNLDGSLAEEQARWFEAVLTQFEADPATRGVLVFTHHPAYTNGHGREPDSYVRSSLVPPFLRATKTMALLSAHVHGYERFSVGGKAFIVSGGGGGPRVAYDPAPEGTPAPVYTASSGEPRAFHYLVLAEREDSLEIEVKCLSLGAFCPAGLLETFSLPLP
ncbi:MAG TPA: metallophosphoesterase, partial [Polyangiaceae bacterium]|nr:metallophosphoesterase [Polyangiaceae bacterium]